MRRQTHPQATQGHIYMRERQNSAIVYSGTTTSLRPPFLYHSTSLSSIAADSNGIESQTDGLKSRSKPDLDQFARGSLPIKTNALRSPQPQLEPSPNGCVSSSTVGLQLVLLNAKSLEMQLDLLCSNIPSAESSPINDSKQRLLRRARKHAGNVVQSLSQLTDNKPQSRLSSERHFSHSSSYTTNMSRMSSYSLENQTTDKELQLDSSIKSESGKSDHSQ